MSEHIRLVQSEELFVLRGWMGLRKVQKRRICGKSSISSSKGISTRIITQRICNDYDFHPFHKLASPEGMARRDSNEGEVRILEFLTSKIRVCVSVRLDKGWHKGARREK